MIEFFEQLEPLVVRRQEEYRKYIHPPVAVHRWPAYQKKQFARLQAAEKDIDDLILKRATQIRKDRKASKE